MGMYLYLKKKKRNLIVFRIQRKGILNPHGFPAVLTSILGGLWSKPFCNSSLRKISSFPCDVSHLHLLDSDILFMRTVLTELTYNSLLYLNHCNDFYMLLMSKQYCRGISTLFYNIQFYL